MRILEKHIEQKLIREMKKIGGRSYKWTSPNQRGVLDRICIFPNGNVVFTEVKKPDGKLTPLQQLMIRTLRDLNCFVEVVYTKEDVENLIKIYG